MISLITVTELMAFYIYFFFMWFAMAIITALIWLAMYYLPKWK